MLRAVICYVLFPSYFNLFFLVNCDVTYWWIVTSHISDVYNVLCFLDVYSEVYHFFGKDLFSTRSIEVYILFYPHTSTYFEWFSSHLHSFYPSYLYVSSMFPYVLNNIMNFQCSLCSHATISFKSR